jgi:hypothetical protein
MKINTPEKGGLALASPAGGKGIFIGTGRFGSRRLVALK